MRASFDFGSGAGGTTAGQLPFRILVMGPFAGDGGARPGAQAPAAAGATRPARVEAEGFDALVERVLGPLTLKDLTWPGAGSPTALTLRFTALKSFRPEALASQLPGGADALAAREFLLQLKARRLNRADTRAKLRELGLPGDLAASVDAAFKAAQEVYKELDEKNANWKKVYPDYSSFLAQQVQWQSVAEANYTQYLAAQKL